MRHRETLSRDYFEELYAASSDPWNFSASDYERQKYEVTLAAIGSGHPSPLADAAFPQRNMAQLRAGHGQLSLRSCFAWCGVGS